MTWILTEIPCHFSSQIEGSLVQIHTKFHVIYPGFICFPCWNMTWILDKFKSWNFHGICSENDGNSIGFGDTFDQSIPSRRHENTMSHFLHGYLQYFNNYYDFLGISTTSHNVFNSTMKFMQIYFRL